jgi:hypothetical protein
LFFLQHLEEFLEYFRFGLWWVALGVASSIGLGKYNWCAPELIMLSSVVGGPLV